MPFRVIGNGPTSTYVEWFLERRWRFAVWDGAFERRRIALRAFRPSVYISTWVRCRSDSETHTPACRCEPTMVNVMPRWERSLMAADVAEWSIVPAKTMLCEAVW